MTESRVTLTSPVRPAPRIRRVVRPTLRGGLFLATGATLFIIAWGFDQRDLLFIAAVLLLVPLASLGYVLVHPLRVHVLRAFRPVSVSAGSAATVTLQVRNLSGQTLAGLHWRDTADRQITVPDAQPLRTLGPARPGPPSASDTVVVSYQLRPAKRGRYPIGPVLLARVDPFGLAYGEWPVATPHDLTVTPRITPLPGSGVLLTRGEGSRHERLRHLNDDSDELIAREYRQGDPMRRVNWPATARHGEIMVRQEEQRSHPEARLLLDTTRSGSGRSHSHVAEFERAVELTASIAVHLLESGFRVEMIETGPAQLVPPPLAPSRASASARRMSADPDAGRRGGLRGDDPVSFAGPEGSHTLLDALARITQRDHINSGRAAAGGDAGPRPTGPAGDQIPTFAVLVDTDPGDTADLVALRPLSRPAVAFVFDSADPAAVHLLAEAGWHCVWMTGSTPVDAAWLAATRDEGERHGRY
jgi:uncharacterized protein (DUF58 family)